MPYFSQYIGKRELRSWSMIVYAMFSCSFQIAEEIQYLDYQSVFQPHQELDLPLVTLIDIISLVVTWKSISAFFRFFSP